MPLLLLRASVEDCALLVLLLLVAPAVSATNSGTNGAGTDPVKIYTINGTLIPQETRGGSNTGKEGGVIIQTSPAASMMASIKSPITFYIGGNNAVINQSGHTKELFDYYWSSYSRGTDGVGSDALLNNDYLDGYSTLRTKSIYDPCPYSYRTYTNGTYNQFSNTYLKWTQNSYIGGAKWTLSTNSTWLPNTGYRYYSTGMFVHVGNFIGYRNATASNATGGYVLYFNFNNTVYTNHSWGRSEGTTIRCIDFVSLVLLLLVLDSHQDASATTSGVV